MRVLVETSAGHGGVEMPRRFRLDGRKIEVTDNLDQWHGAARPLLQAHGRRRKPLHSAPRRKACGMGADHVPKPALSGNCGGASTPEKSEVAESRCSLRLKVAASERWEADARCDTPVLLYAQWRSWQLNMQRPAEAQERELLCASKKGNLDAVRTRSSFCFYQERAGLPGPCADTEL